MVALTITPVYGAAFMAQWMGFGAGRRLAREPLPEPRLRGEPWHALGAVEVLRALHRRGAYAGAPEPETDEPSADWLAMAPGRAAHDDAAGTGHATDSLARELGRVLAVRGTATALGAVTAWQLGRMSGRAVRANTMGLAALVGTQLGQTLATDWRSPLVLLTGAASTAVLAGVIQTPGVSHFFGCTPLGPVAWTTVAACSSAATVAAALAPGLLARRAPAPVTESAAALNPVPAPV